MLHYYKLFWINALNVTGRSRRKEYWYPILMNILLYIVISLFLYITNSNYNRRNNWLVNIYISYNCDVHCYS